MVGISEVAQALKLEGGVEAHASTHEFVRAAKNCLDFGKRTVNVAASVKILFAPTPDVAKAQAMLKFRASLPAALAKRLEELADGCSARTSPSSEGCQGIGSSSSVAPTLAAKSVGSALKRSRSGLNTGGPPARAKAAKRA